MAKKIQVTIDDGIYEILVELRDKVYKTNSLSKVCSSLIESFLEQKGFLSLKLEKSKGKWATGTALSACF